MSNHINKVTKEIRVRQSVTYNVEYCFCNAKETYVFEKTDTKEYPIRLVEYVEEDAIVLISNIWEGHLGFIKSIIDSKYGILLNLK